MCLSIKTTHLVQWRIPKQRRPIPFLKGGAKSSTACAIEGKKAINILSWPFFTASSQSTAFQFAKRSKKRRQSAINTQSNVHLFPLIAKGIKGVFWNHHLLTGVVVVIFTHKSFSLSHLHTLNQKPRGFDHVQRTSLQRHTQLPNL